ncbi:2-oxo-tetronate isomerase [Vibrio cholerae]|uniref:2-oxo-tetronate isomerase n=1 Tax=Vibrio cholerae TaxID=666 RepID=UPI00301AA667
MAKFAANLTMLFNEVSFLERFEQAHRAGFKAIEFLFPYAFEPQLLAAKLEQYGFEQALFNMPPGDWDAGEKGFAALPGREQEFKQSVATALMYAKALSCKKVHAMSGIIKPAYSMQQHIDTFIANIRYAADTFAVHGIDVLIEPLNTRDVPNYFVAHQRRAVELIQMVDRPNVKLQLDLYHAQIMDGDLDVLIRDLAPFTGHIQIASVPHRNEPAGGEINYPYLFDVLDDSGYDGWIGCEYKPKTTTEQGLAWVRPYL